MKSPSRPSPEVPAGDGGHPAVAALPSHSHATVAAASCTAAVAAASPKAPEDDMGIIRKAMAFRVKYRVLTETGQLKRRLPLRALSVHFENRGGVYPQGDVVKNLGVKLGMKGFSQEEADHQGVCVQEAPNTAVADSLFHWNKTRCEGQAALNKCFGADSLVSYGTLSHSHLLLVLLSWLGGAMWELSEDESKKVPWDAKQRLDLEAAVAVPNLAELYKTCQDGLLMEVLSWKLVQEEPGAASLISQALNTGNQIALRTTELTALSVLSGECALQRRSRGGDTVVFEEVKAAVRSQLDVFVDEAEFQALFDFVVNLGAMENPFIPDLLDFGSRFVDQKQRQLRLGAFVEANKVNMHFPRLKIAMLKRAYRKKRCMGFAHHLRADSTVVDLQGFQPWKSCCTTSTVSAKPQWRRWEQNMRSMPSLPMSTLQ